MARRLVLGTALTALAVRLLLREYVMTYLVPWYNVYLLPEVDLEACDPHQHITTVHYDDLRVPAATAATRRQRTTPREQQCVAQSNDANGEDVICKIESDENGDDDDDDDDDDEEEDVAEITARLKHHGVLFFEDLLDESQTAALRSYIATENHNPHRAHWFVLDPDNRQHLVYGIREHAIVANAIHTILSAQPLRDVLRHYLGHGAALDDDLRGVTLQELASITSYAGATGQAWHKDVTPTGRELPMYSLFVNLNPNLNATQGPTAVCAGSHVCDCEYSTPTCCDAWDMTILSSSSQRAGTAAAALLNSQLYHRGTAHTSSQQYPLPVSKKDPSEKDPQPKKAPPPEGVIDASSPNVQQERDETARIMFYMSFTVAPAVVRNETLAAAAEDDNHNLRYKLPPNGATYALRHDMWGQTLQDVWEATRPSSSNTYFEKTAPWYQNAWHYLLNLYTSVTGGGFFFLFFGQLRKHRGWTLIEMLLIEWSTMSDIYDTTLEDVEDVADVATCVTCILLILYVLIAELEFCYGDGNNKSRNDQDNATTAAGKESSTNGNSSSSTGVARGQ